MIPDEVVSTATAGQWVMLDATGRLLSIGQSLYHGQSARAHVDGVARRHLLPLLHDLAGHRSAASSQFTFGARRWVAAAEPIIGPTGALHGRLGIYYLLGETPPPRPQVGCWEWDAPALTTYWDRRLFAVYGFPEPPEGRDHWDAPEWFNLLERGGYPQMREVLASFQTASPESLIIHLFRIARADNGQMQTLRLAGRTIADADGKPLHFRGTTTRVDGFQLEIDETFTQQQYLDAALALSPLPICVLDLHDDRIFVSSLPLSAIGLAPLGPDQQLSGTVHPDDYRGLRAALAQAPQAPTATPARVYARFATATGWRRVEVSAIRVGARREGFEQVMMRLGVLAA